MTPNDLRRVVELEAALDRALPAGPFPRAPTPELLQAGAAWSACVWHNALAAGPIAVPEEDVRRGLDLGARPVFLCGAHRSGTTLLQNLLDGHPALLVLPSEGSFFTQVEPLLRRAPESLRAQLIGCEWLRRLANPSNQRPFWLLGRSTADGSPYVTFTRAFLAWWPVCASHFAATVPNWPLIPVALAYASCRSTHLPARLVRWVEKSPGNEQHLPRLWRAFPEAKAIHIIRDPADVFASRCRIEPRASRPGRRRAQVLRELAATYSLAHEYSSRSDAQRYRLVRYEQLVAERVSVMNAVAKFLDIEIVAELYEPTVADAPALPNTSFALTDGGAICHASKLAPGQGALLDACVGASAERLGYRRTETLSKVRAQLIRLVHGVW
jgi:hypothetical protein